MTVMQHVEMKHPRWASRNGVASNHLRNGNQGTHFGAHHSNATPGTYRKAPVLRSSHWLVIFSYRSTWSLKQLTATMISGFVQWCPWKWRWPLEVSRFGMSFISQGLSPKTSPIPIIPLKWYQSRSVDPKYSKHSWLDMPSVAPMVSTDNEDLTENPWVLTGGAVDRRIYQRVFNPWIQHHCEPSILLHH